MKIGMLTFHRALNYGAVLQAFALQSFILGLGHYVEFIDYYPAEIYSHKVNVRSFLSKNPISMLNKWLALLVGLLVRSKFRRFRHNLIIGSKVYSSPDEIYSSPPQYDVYLVGSDVVWSCLDRNAGKVFSLSFCGEFDRRVAYAVSFGDGMVSLQKHVVGLSKFDAISVRERGSVSVLTAVGLRNVCHCPDPTILHPVAFYRRYLGKKVCDVFVYVLHGENCTVNTLCANIAANEPSWVIVNCVLGLKQKVQYGKTKILSVPSWLSGIAYSKIVLTNSYHCVVFAILFHRPFVYVPIPGNHSKLNDRLYSLFDSLGIQFCITIHSYQDALNYFTDEKWNDIDLLIAGWREVGVDFLEKTLSSCK